MHVHLKEVDSKIDFWGVNAIELLASALMHFDSHHICPIERCWPSTMMRCTMRRGSRTANLPELPNPERLSLPTSNCLCLMRQELRDEPWLQRRKFEFKQTNLERTMVYGGKRKGFKVSELFSFQNTLKDCKYVVYIYTYTHNHTHTYIYILPMICRNIQVSHIFGSLLPLLPRNIKIRQLMVSAMFTCQEICFGIIFFNLVSLGLQ